MTDPIVCPECGGSGEERIGKLCMVCNFCHGRGKVGGDFEPAEGGHQRADGYRQPREGETYNPDLHGPLSPVQAHPAVRRSGLCPDCLGAKVILASRTYRQTPCPRCQKNTPTS